MGQRLVAVMERADQGSAVQAARAARARAAAGAVQRGGRAAGDCADAGVVVPGAAADEHRRHLHRCRRYPAERGGVQPPGHRPRGGGGRVPAGAPGRAGRMRNPCPDRRRDRCLHERGAHADPGPARLARRGDAGAGRPELLRLRAVERGSRNRRAAAVADQGRPRAATRRAAARRLVPVTPAQVRRTPPSDDRHRRGGAGDRLRYR